MITENHRVDYYTRKVDDVQYTREDFELAEAMKKSLRYESRKDKFLAYVLENRTHSGLWSIKVKGFQYGDFFYELDTRCKWDWWLP